MLSCWDDSNNTDIVDHHDYGTAFKTHWEPKLYGDEAKGALVTEGGSLAVILGAGARGRSMHQWLLACDSTCVRLEIASASRGLTPGARVVGFKRTNIVKMAISHIHGRMVHDICGIANLPTGDPCGAVRL